MGYAIYDSSFGKIKIGFTDQAITMLHLVAITENVDVGVPSKLSDLAFLQLTEYFLGKRKAFAFPIEMQGTDFQKKVWQALCDIPYGETRSYQEIAIAIGNPKACRAVGMANNKNPIAIAVPCHRVIGANGSLVGYAGGLQTKSTLLELEKKNKNT